MLKLRRAHARHKKRRAKIDPRQESQRQRSRSQRTRRLPDLHQPAGFLRRSASPVRPAHRIHQQRRRQQQLDPAHQPRAPCPRPRNSRPHDPHRRRKNHVPGQARGQKQPQLPAVQPHSPRLNHHPRHHHRPAGCQAHRPRRESKHQRLSGAGRKRECRHLTCSLRLVPIFPS